MKPGVRRWIVAALMAVAALMMADGLYAAGCYSTNYSKAEAFFKQGNYSAAIKRYKAANACPDKPKSNNIAARISECERRLKPATTTTPRPSTSTTTTSTTTQRTFRIVDVEFRNEDIDDNVLDPYGAYLYASKVCYLMPRITYDGPSSSREMTLYYKIFDPSGNMRSGSGSPSGYTNSVSITANPGRNTIGIGGWGSSSPGTYSAGEYTFEIWSSGGSRLFRKKFTLHPGGTSTNTSSRTGTIESIWVDYDQWQDGQKGMLIHTKFVVDGMLGRTGRCVAYFYFENGDPLKDFNENYRTVDGKVSVGDDFEPRYESTRFSDFKLFMPYDELHMASGSYELKFYVLVYDKVTEEDLAESDWQHFTFSK